MNNREAFEAWAEKELLPLDRRDSDHYRYNLTNRAWAGWQSALASQQQDHIGDSTKLVQAVNALAAQTGESAESITEWLTDKGGLTQLMLSHFGGMQSQAQQPAFPPRDLTKPAEQQGMFSKFHVERVDGSSAKGGKHHGCRYWVLDLDHDKHAPAGMRGYAEDCKETHPVLSAEIFAEFGMQSQAQQPTEESVNKLRDLADQCKVAASCLTYNGARAEAVAKHLLLEASQGLRRSQAQQTEKKQLSPQDILKIFYTLKDKDKHFPMIEREISSALGSQLFVYGWIKAVEFDIQPPAPEGGNK